MTETTIDLQQWVIGRVAEYCRRATSDVDPDENFTNYGMDSVYALALVGDIEDQFGQQVPATTVWDHPTINKLVAFIRSSTKED